MSRFGIVHSSFWLSDTLRTLEDDAKLLAIYLLTCEHCSSLGAFRLPRAYILHDLNWTSTERLSKGFQSLTEAGFLEAAGEFIWIKNYLKWNKPTNSKHLKGLYGQLEALVREATNHAGFAKGLDRAIRGLLKGVSNRFDTTENENEKETEKEKKEEPPKPPRVPDGTLALASLLLAAWNEQGTKHRHRRVSEPIIKAVRKCLKAKRDEEELITAIRNYRRLTTEPNAKVYEWTLAAFLTRDSGNLIDRFQDYDAELAKARDWYRRENGNRREPSAAEDERDRQRREAELEELRKEAELFDRIAAGEQIDD